MHQYEYKKTIKSQKICLILCCKEPFEGNSKRDIGGDLEIAIVLYVLDNRFFFILREHHPIPLILYKRDIIYI
jgi:hypothetical protein